MITNSDFGVRIMHINDRMYKLSLMLNFVISVNIFLQVLKTSIAAKEELVVILMTRFPSKKSDH